MYNITISTSPYPTYTSPYPTFTVFTSISTTTKRLLEVDNHGRSILELISIVFSILVLIIGLVGNTLVLYVFGSRYKRLKTCEKFMVSLGVADFIATIVVPTKTFMELLNYSFKPIGDYGCKVISFISISSIAVSALTLTIISIDRYRIVKWPLKHRPSTTAILSAILLCWVLGFSIGIPYFIDNRIKLHQDILHGGYFCRDFGTDSIMKQHMFIAISLQIILPFITITILYTLIIYELQKGTQNTLFRHQQRLLEQRLKQNHKATVLLVTIACVFYVCVIPINIFYAMYMYGAVHLSTNNVMNVFSILTMFQMVTSCVNPVIYSKLHTTFRRSLAKYLRVCGIKRFYNDHSTKLSMPMKTTVLN